jgi:hypothetical protein
LLEAILEFLVELVLDALLEALFELACEVGIESLRGVVRPRQRAHPALATIGLLLLGSGFGAVSAWLLPRPLIAPGPVPGIACCSRRCLLASSCKRTEHGPKVTGASHRFLRHFGAAAASRSHSRSLAESSFKGGGMPLNKALEPTAAQPTEGQLAGGRRWLNARSFGGRGPG